MTMKRRRFVQSISLLYGSPSVFAQAIAKLDTVATDTDHASRRDA